MNRLVLPSAMIVSAAVLTLSAVAIFEFTTDRPDNEARNLSANLPLFQFEREAQLHCPNDSIVWATANVGTYSLSDDRWYGRTSSGAYGCRHETENAGYRATRVRR